MKRAFLILCIVVLRIFPSSAQLCPGGGADFLTAVTFDPAWIYGCNTGTSCNGGVALDNRIACLPITLLDVCAPAPSCGTANNASNAWFKFFAISSTANISCFQNTSFVIGIQAFSGGPLCGTLTQIGCALAGGPSSGVQLSLTGLTPGQLYYFRIFGSATPVSQRTGLYCFCGTTGLSNTVLPIITTDFKAVATTGNVELSWNTVYEKSNSSIELEHSADAKNFTTIARMNGDGMLAIQRAYSYTDINAVKGNNYYRLKQVTADGKYSYSAVVMIKVDIAKPFTAYTDLPSRQLRINVSTNTTLTIYNAAGILQQTIHLLPGAHSISTAQMARGIYFLRTAGDATVKKVYVD